MAAEAAAEASRGLQVLASGWQEVRGPSGTYYCNAATGETSWDKPTMAAPSAIEAETQVKEAQFKMQEAESSAAVKAREAQEQRVAAQAAAAEEARLGQAVHAAHAAMQQAEVPRLRRNPPVPWALGDPRAWALVRPYCDPLATPALGPIATLLRHQRWALLRPSCDTSAGPYCDAITTPALGPM